MIKTYFQIFIATFLRGT